MGGMLKAIAPSSPKSSQTPSQSQPQAQAQAQAQATAAAAVTEATDRQHRQEALARVRAGRAGTIATSSRGLLTAADWLPTRKSLLGE